MTYYMYMMGDFLETPWVSANNVDDALLQIETLIQFQEYLPGIKPKKENLQRFNREKYIWEPVR